MDIGTRFMAYAADFERTYADDDWDRLRTHFCDDAVYEVVSASFPCRLVGPDAIFAGIKKSLDGFDRVFDAREIAVTGAPELDGDELRITWTVTYRKGDLDPFVLHGRTVARGRDGKIGALSDLYDDSVERDLAAWVAATGVEVNASYT